jgi:hypothetical protein
MKKNVNYHADTPRKGAGRPAKHGAYSSLAALDNRTRLARALAVLRQELVTALGGNPSVQERLVIDRCVYKAARIHAWETATMNGADPSSIDQVYLAWANSLRLDLQALGLERRAAPVQTLQEYLRERAASNETDHDTTKGTRADRNE